ncbi:MAG: hypothetical protein V3V41_00545 [Candidatus Heimdallarchaeota archaeon]
MNSKEKTTEISKPALYAIAFLLSLVGGILFFTTEFGWWQGGYSWGYDFALYGEFVEWYGKLALVLLGLLFLFVAFVSLQKLYPFLKIPDEVEDKLEKISFYAAIGVIVLTVITAILFVVQVSDATDWDFGTTFYTGLIGGIVTVLLLWFARRNESPAK